MILINKRNPLSVNSGTLMVTITICADNKFFTLSPFDHILCGLEKYCSNVRRISFRTGHAQWFASGSEK